MKPRLGMASKEARVSDAVARRERRNRERGAMPTDLKPCPFCGSPDVESCPEGERRDGRPWFVYYVHCNICDCDGPYVGTDGRNASPGAARDASIDLWNRRVE